MFPSLLKPVLLISYTVVAIFIAVFAYTKLAGPIPFSVNSVSTQKTDSFSVTGEGKASIKPDKAVVRLGVTADGSTADEAKNKMNQTNNKVTAAIKALGVAEKDIKTEYLNVNQNFDVRPMTLTQPADAPVTAPIAKDPNSRATSYIANINLVITLTDVELANRVIDTATQNGANQIGGIEFNNLDTTEAENEARQKAVADAKKKAEMAAVTAGFTLGKLINYQENGGGSNPPIMYAAKAEDSRSSEQTQVQSGENEISVTVTLFYEVR